MPGYRQWSNGDNLTPADLDGYLMGQTIMRFANAAARTAALSTPVAGMQSYLTDTGLTYLYSGGQWSPLSQFIKKAANETVTSNTTVQNDDHLLVALVPGTYRVETFLHATGAQAGDIKVQWSFSGTLSDSSRVCIGPGIATIGVAGAATTAGQGLARTTTHFITTAVSYGTDGSNSSGIYEDMYLVVTATGTLQMQWAQDTSSATGTVLSTASRMYVNRLA